MSNCTKCNRDIDEIEVIERTAKSGKNAGSKYKARICPCGTFNFLDSGSAPAQQGDYKEVLKKLDEILYILKADKQPSQETVNPDGVVNPGDVAWEE